MNAIEAIGVTRRYGGFKALDGVNLEVETGRIHGLIGPNGAGKSTLIDVLSGRAREWGGAVKLFGQDISSLTVQERRSRGLARSFQRTSIFAGLSVRQQLELAARTVQSTDVGEVMTQLGLERLADRVAADLSYGDQRRLDLALALIGKPKVLLLDEPAAGLTMEESLALAELLESLARQWGVTVVLVEHDMEVVFSICERITVLHLGRVLVEGTPDEIRRDPEVVRAYLGSAADTLQEAAA